MPTNAIMIRYFCIISHRLLYTLVISVQNTLLMMALTLAFVFCAPCFRAWPPTQYREFLLLNNLALTKLISMLKCLLLQFLSGLNIYFYVTGRGTPIRHVLGKSKMIVGLLEGIPTMLKGEVAMVMFS